jgi:hypothetical protein
MGKAQGVILARIKRRNIFPISAKKTKGAGLTDLRIMFK